MCGIRLLYSVIFGSYAGGTSSTQGMLDIFVNLLYISNLLIKYLFGKIFTQWRWLSMLCRQLCLYGPCNYDYKISDWLIYRVGCALVTSKIASFINNLIIFELSLDCYSHDL